ncbi:hypothetical protein ACFQZ1_08770, partial [Bacillus sp. CGMCC 1.60114]
CFHLNKFCFSILITPLFRVLVSVCPSSLDFLHQNHFEQCVKWFKFNKADESNPAHFIKMFGQQYKAYLDRRDREESEAISNLDKKRESTFIFYDFLKGN